MLLIFGHLCILLALAVLSEAGARPTECQMWEEVSASTMNQEFLNVTCGVSGICTGFNCSGVLLFENSVFEGREPFGFSLEFIPCSYPLVLRLHVNSSDLQFTKLIGVHGRNEETVLLVMPNAGDQGNEETYGRLNLAWNAILKPVKYVVSLEINFTRVFFSGEFPPIQLVPMRNYPIPNCHYEPPAVHITPDNTPKVIGCEGKDCANREMPYVVHTPDPPIDYDFIFKMSVGVGVFLVGLCVLVGIVLIRHRRRSKESRKLQVEDDFPDEPETEEESITSPRDNLEDTRNLLRA